MRTVSRRIAPTAADLGTFGKSSGSPGRVYESALSGPFPRRVGLAGEAIHSDRLALSFERLLSVIFEIAAHAEVGGEIVGED